MIGYVNTAFIVEKKLSVTQLRAPFGLNSEVTDRKPVSVRLFRRHGIKEAGLTLSEKQMLRNPGKSQKDIF